MSAFLVYMLTCRVNGKRYIGVTTMTLQKRIKWHVNNARRDDFALSRAILKHGISSFDATVIYEAIDRREMYMVERGLISQYGTYRPHGYNATSGGEGSSDHRISHEKRLSRNRNLAIAYSSDEGRARQSEKMRGKTRSEEDKQKKREAARAYAQSPEGKADYARRAEKAAAWHRSNPGKSAEIQAIRSAAGLAARYGRSSLQ